MHKKIETKQQNYYLENIYHLIRDCIIKSIYKVSSFVSFELNTQYILSQCTLKKNQLFYNENKKITFDIRLDFSQFKYKTIYINSTECHFDSFPFDYLVQ